MITPKLYVKVKIARDIGYLTTVLNDIIGLNPTKSNHYYLYEYVQNGNRLLSISENTSKCV